MKQSSTSKARGRGKKTNARPSAAQDRSGGRSSQSSGSRTGQAGSGNSQAGSGRSNQSGGGRSSQTGSRSGQQHARGNSASTGAGRKQGEGSGTRSRTHAGNFEGASYLEKFFLDQLHDIYYAEQKITQSLPKMQKAATTNELKEAFEDHLHQTQRHVKRLEKVFETIGKKAEGKKCEAIEGIAREVETIISETEEGSLTRDAALIIAAQKVEHYEIATYGGLVQLAITMELHDAADILDKTLVEEEDTDARLTEIAENEINLGAEHEGNRYSWNAGAGENEGSDEDAEDVDEESPALK